MQVNIDFDNVASVNVLGFDIYILELNSGYGEQHLEIALDKKVAEELFYKLGQKLHGKDFNYEY